jgi:uncharacterized protein (TIGR00369 family)
LPNLDRLLAANPYISHLGLEFHLEESAVIAHLPYKNDLIGNPMIPAVHGGVIAASMELVAVAQLMLDAELKILPKTVNISIDYLRSGKTQPIFAKAKVFKLGRRVANIEAIAWQESEDKPIAKLHGNFLIQKD